MLCCDYADDGGKGYWQEGPGGNDGGFYEEKLKILKHRTHQQRRRLRLAAMLMSAMVWKLLVFRSGFM